jgi:hypothetical protein
MREPNVGMHTGTLYLTRVEQVIQGFSGSYRKFTRIFPALRFPISTQPARFVLKSCQFVSTSAGYPTRWAVDSYGSLSKELQIGSRGRCNGGFFAGKRAFEG